MDLILGCHELVFEWEGFEPKSFAKDPSLSPNVVLQFDKLDWYHQLCLFKGGKDKVYNPFCYILAPQDFKSSTTSLFKGHGTSNI